MYTHTAWVLYGSAIVDPFVLTPNSIGLCAALIQIALLKMYPRIPQEAEPLPNSPSHFDFDDLHENNQNI